MNNPKAPTHNEKTIAKRETYPSKLMSLTFETASQLYNIANLLLILALAVGVAATILIVWMGNVKETYLREDLAAAATYASEADARAAEARLETEQIKAELAWRTITPELEDNLLTALSPYQGVITIKHVSNDPEAVALAVEFANLFVKAKWHVSLLNVTFPNVYVTGLYLPDTTSPHTKILREAFQAA